MRLAAGLLAALAVLALGCARGDRADRQDGAAPIGGGGAIDPAQLATSEPAGADLVHEFPTPAAASETASPGPAPPEIAGAEPIGGGGPVHPTVAPLELRVEGAALDELDLYEATALAVDPDGGVWVLVQGEPGTGRTPIAHGHRATALRVVGDHVERGRTIPGGSQVWLLTDEAGGEVAIGTLAYGEVAQPGGIGETGGTTDLHLLAPDPAEDRAIRVAREDLVQVGPLATTAGGTLLAGHDDRARIDEIEPDGDVRHLLGFSGFDPDAAVQLDEPLGEIRSLAALPDGRVGFVTRNRGEQALRVLDDDQVRTIDVTPHDRSRDIHTITPGPDGQLLAVAAGPDIHPQIWVIDAGTGRAQVVADLEGVLRHPDGPRGIPGALWPVAAAADGEDLVFLADGFLWRRPDAFE
jgi:hypothetical protein